MEYTGTKKRILEAALDLFSKYGYEATSMSQIAEAVGMTKASIYSHFESKQDIFEKFLEQVAEYYEKHAYFSTNNLKESSEIIMTLKDKSAKEVAEIINKQIDFLAFDPVISKLRKVLTIEQFRNEEIRKIKEQRSYVEISSYYVEMMKYFIKEGVFKEGDPETMSLLFTSPISVQLERLDRDPSLKDEAHKIIEKSVIEFYRIYGKK